MVTFFSSIGNERAKLLAVLLPLMWGCGARSEILTSLNEAPPQCADGAIAGAVGCQTLTFADPVNYPVDVVGGHVIIADLNGDNALDLAVASWDTDTVAILLNQGDGVFSTAASYPTSSEGGSSGIAAGDLNGDGALDLVIPPALDSATLVSVLYNNGSGAFAPAMLTPAGLGASSVALGDYNDDGWLDIATPSAWDDDLTILTNLGDGTFSSPVSHGPLNAPIAVTAADLDMDGHLDLAVTSAVTSGITILRNTGSGTFGIPVNYAGSGRHDIVSGDVNGDLWPDLLSTNVDGVDVLLNTGGGVFGGAASYPMDVNAIGLVAADLNDDCRVDVAAASEQGTVGIFTNLGDGTFGPVDTHVVEKADWKIAAGDLDGDGQVDLAVTYVAAGLVTVLLNRGCAP